MSNSKESKQPYIDQPVDGVTPINVDNAQGAVTEEIRKRFLLGSKTGNLCIRGDASKGLWAGDVSFDGAVANNKWWVKLDGTSSGGGSGGLTKIYAYQSTPQTLGAGLVQVTFNTEIFDTNNEFAANAFTAKVAGYYHVKAQWTSAAGSASGQMIGMGINHSGTYDYHAFYLAVSGGGNQSTAIAEGDVYCNVGDTIKAYSYVASGSINSDGSRGGTNICINSI